MGKVDPSKRRLKNIVNSSAPHAPSNHGEVQNRIAAAAAHRTAKAAVVAPPIGALFEAAVRFHEERNRNEDSGQDWIFVPAHPAIVEGVRIIEFETRELDGVGTVLPVFSSQDGLVAQLGPHQPWAKVKIQAMVNLMGMDKLALDPVIEEKAEKWNEHKIHQFMMDIANDSRRGNE